MKIKVDITEATCFVSGQVIVLTIPELHTQKTVMPFLKRYFREEKFKLLTLNRERNVEIPVIEDSVTQSIHEYFDTTAIIEGYSELNEEKESEVK